MIQYIYFVKCPNCEDEHFDFFEEAKGFAMGCLSKKPIITQTEVCRNDFGECTDHCDLGTVWSWEDEMKDAETEEPGTNIFNKGDFGEYNPDNDTEFADDDFFAVNEFDEALAEKLDTTHGYDDIKYVATLVHSAVDNYTKDNKVATRADGTSFYVLSDKANSNPEKMKQIIIDTLRKDGYEPEVVQYVENGNLYGYVIEKIKMTSRTKIKESTKMSADEMKDKFGTIEVDLINAGREEDDRVELQEDTNVKTWNCWYDNRVIGTVEASDEEEAAEKMISVSVPSTSTTSGWYAVDLYVPARFSSATPLKEMLLTFSAVGLIFR